MRFQRALLELYDKREKQSRSISKVFSGTNHNLHLETKGTRTREGHGALRRIRYDEEQVLRPGIRNAGKQAEEGARLCSHPHG